MFRTIDKSVTKIQKKLYLTQKRAKEIDTIFISFITKELGLNCDRFTYKLDFDLQNKRLMITTNNKAFANELIIVSKALTHFFKDQGVFLSQLVIK